MLLNGNGHKQTSNDLPKLEEKEPGSFLLNCHYIQIKPLCRQHVLSLPDWMVASPKACQPELTPDFGNRQMAWTTKANTWSLSRTWTYCACTCSQLRSWCTPHSTVAKNEDQCTAINSYCLQFCQGTVASSSTARLSDATVLWTTNIAHAVQVQCPDHGLSSCLTGAYTALSSEFVIQCRLLPAVRL